MRCPRCGFINPDTAQRCDCEEEFLKRISMRLDEDFPSFEPAPAVERAYPAVERAYKPSGKGTPEARLVMLLIGLPGGIVAGLLLHFLLLLLHNVIDAFVIAIITFGLGGLLGYLVHLCAFKGKSRSAAQIKKLSLLCALAGYATFVIAGAPARVEMFGSVLGFIGGGLQFLVFVGSTLLSLEIIKRPFCEVCDEFMESISSGGIPLSMETALMHNLKSGAFGNIHSLVSPSVRGGLFPGGDGGRGDCEVTFYYCDYCKDSGFLDVVEHWRSVAGDGVWVDDPRLVFSTSLQGDEIRTLLGSRIGKWKRGFGWV